MPFTWGQSAESSTTNRTAAMEYLKGILGTPAGQAYHDCASTRNMLSCQLPGTGYNLKGSTDIAICTSAAVESNIPATGLHVLFEVKETKAAFSTFQLAAELLAAHVWTAHLQPIAVMTDLMDGWCLMWAAAEKELKIYTSRDRAEAVGILRAFLDKDVLSADSTHIVHQQQDAAASGGGAAGTEAEAGGLLKRRRLQMGAGSGAGADVANLNDLLDFGGDLGLGEADLHQLRSRMQLEALLELAAPVFRAAAVGGS
ncbi:hypothetical protein TSOC_014500, partial [Tetrabaena socialis]